MSTPTAPLSRWREDVQGRNLKNTPKISQLLPYPLCMAITQASHVGLAERRAPTPAASRAASKARHQLDTPGVAGPAANKPSVGSGGPSLAVLSGQVLLGVKPMECSGRTMPLAESPLRGGLPVITVSALLSFFSTV